MVRLIMGVKGSGKTKRLIELINNSAKDEPGNVVCIEANRNLTYDIHYHIRLIDAQEYKLNSYDLLRGFISGLYAGNYDISHVFIDNLFKIVGGEIGSDTENFLNWLDRFGEQNNIKFTVSISCLLYTSSGSQSISQLRFVPASSYTGSVEIPYVAYSSTGNAIASGKLCLGRCV